MGFAQLHGQIRYKAVEKGISAETVNPHNTSKECNGCAEEGYRPKQATFECTNDDCGVGEYQADVNGAVNIVDRYLSGERRSREHENDDDSAEDGAGLAFDRATRQPSR